MIVTIEASLDYPSWDLTSRQVCDVELLLNGAFHPLTGFMSQAEVMSAGEKNEWREHFWPVPVVLDVTADFAAQLEVGQHVALRDQEGVLVAILRLSECYDAVLVEACCGSIDLSECCLAGDIVGLEAPVHHDFQRIRLTPDELKNQFAKLGWRNVLGFATREPLHQRQVHETYNAARAIEANLLLSPAVGAVSAEDTEHYANVHCYEHVLSRFPGHTTDLCLLPLVNRNLGVSDALLHAVVLRNCGCSHYMIDEDYCSSGETGLDYAGLQEALSACDGKVGIKLTRNEQLVQCSQRGGFVPRSSLDGSAETQELSHTQFEARLREGLDVPAWYSYPDVVETLRKIYRPRSEAGFTIFFTGLSGSGKSTIANAILVRMMEMSDRPITLLDGDVVRQNLSSELGFSKEHRDINIRRIGYVASEITKHGGIAICAPIAPYALTRRVVRGMIEKVGGFIEVHVATGLAECERRDRKGLYAKARAGVIKEFTGISDPYEQPENPELTIDTEGMPPEQAAQKVILTLEKLGYIKNS